MKHRVRILRRAQSDLLEIQRYVARDSPPAAERVVSSLLEAVESLANTPLRGTIPRDGRLKAQGYRFLVVAPYLVFYKVVRQTVRIYRVLHGRRAYERHL